MEYDFALQSFIAGIAASIACGLGVIPLWIRGLHIERHIGLGYAFAGGLMMAASVYNLLMPAFTQGSEAATDLWPVLQVIFGIVLGCGFIWFVGHSLTEKRLKSGWLRMFHGKTETLVFIAMLFHSMPEGVAVGVGYGSETHGDEFSGLGLYIAVAIAIHNMPEGLAVALPMRINGAGFWKCFFFAFLTSLPQPLAAVPASLLVWLFEPLMKPLLGFAAGSMMYLVVVELIPDALETTSRSAIAWSFMLGFCLMVLVQVAL